MKKDIKRLVPSESIKGAIDNEYGNPTIDTRKKEKVFVDGKYNGSIYKVTDSYQQPFKEHSEIKPVPKVVGQSIKRIKELNEESKYTRGEDNILFTYEYKVKGKFNGRSYKSDKEYQIQVSTSHDNYNMKHLKIWKMYWNEDEYEWKYSRQGIVIPIIHGKKFIKQIWEKLYGS